MTRKIALLIAAGAAIATPALAFQTQGEQEASEPSILDRVLDRVPLVGPVHARASYTAALEDRGPGEIRGEAWQFPRVHLNTVYRLETIGDCTRVEEHVRVAAPTLLRGLVIDRARAAHAETLEALR